VGTAAEQHGAADPVRTPEKRWPMAVAVLVTIVLQSVAPKQGRIAPWWVLPIVELVALGAVILRDPGRIDRRTRQARRATLVLLVILTISTLVGLLALMLDILDTNFAARHFTSPGALLGRGAALWVTNVVVFSLWYWELDRGGAAERAAGTGIPPSFGFPEEAMPELVSPGWIPRYPDYLYLGFTNATAFSPTDTLPVRTWAKMTLMAQSTISLLIAIMVIARAINLL